MVIPSRCIAKSCRTKVYARRHLITVKRHQRLCHRRFQNKRQYPHHKPWLAVLRSLPLYDRYTHQSLTLQPQSDISLRHPQYPQPCSLLILRSAQPSCQLRQWLLQLQRFHRLLAGQCLISPYTRLNLASPLRLAHKKAWQVPFRVLINRHHQRWHNLANQKMKLPTHQRYNLGYWILLLDKPFHPPWLHQWRRVLRTI